MTNDISTSWQAFNNPTDQLKELIKLRQEGILSRLKEYQTPGSRGRRSMGPAIRRILRPVNPLLLVTAVSISTIRGNDIDSFISRYCTGFDIPDLEPTLIQLNCVQNDDELSKVLELENTYVQSLIDIGLEIVAHYDGFIPGLDIDNPTLWDAFWGAWLSINPIFQENIVIDILMEIESEQVCDAVLRFIPLDTHFFRVWSIAIQYSHRINSLVHNAREYYDYCLDQATMEVNRILKEGVSSHEKRERLIVATRQHFNMTKLSKRAFRLYQWIPDEISAFAAETQRALKGARQSGSDVSEGEYLKYRIPVEIIELRNQHEQALEEQRRQHGQAI